jgi:hypothetical protein
MTTAADLLALLEAVPNLNVHDGSVDVDETAKVIATPTPYVVFYGSPGRDNSSRFDGKAGGRVVEFQLSGVGVSREQVEGVLNKARAAINRTRLNGSLIKLAVSSMIRRDDDYTTPGNEPLFYGADQYDVASV